MGIQQQMRVEPSASLRVRVSTIPSTNTASQLLSAS